MDSHRIIFAGMAAFSALLLYFLFSYGYYPGLQLRISGQIEKETAARVYWDYGYGFNELDAIDFTLSAGTPADEKPLGKVSIEPAGFKVEGSRGYLFWLVVPRNIVESKKYVLAGRHHWGKWLPVSAKMEGRQLALFPGSRIEFDVADTNLQLFLFKAPQAGCARISSDNAAVRYINGFGRNRQNIVTPIVYASEKNGNIRYLPDRFRQKKQELLPLPQQKLVGIKIEILDDEVKTVAPLSSLKIGAEISRSKGGDAALVIENVLINGVPVDVADPSVRFSGGKSETGMMVFDSEKDHLEITGSIVSYEIVLPKGTPYQALNVYADGSRADHAPVTDKQGRTVITGRAKTQPFKTVLDTVEVVDWKGNAVMLRPNGASTLEAGDGLKPLTQRQFHWLLLAVQAITAALASLLVCRMIGYCIALRNRLAPAGLLPALFVMEGRWLFWGLFFFGIMVNSLFLLAEWPGSLTPDSIEVLRQVRWLKFTNHHPYSYSLGLLGLLNFWDSPLFPIVLQIAAFHLLSAGLFYWLYRNGLNLYLLLPCWLLCICSLPINYLNITLWKDVPFAILMVFWALFLALALYLNILNKQPLQITAEGYFVLAILFVLLCTIRHNGLVFLPVIPFAIIILFRHQWKQSRYFLLTSLVLIAGYFFIIPGIVLQKKPEENGFAQAVAEKKTAGIKSIIQNDGKDYFLEDYLSERTRIFVKTLGTSPKAWIWNNDMQAPPLRWFSVDEARAEMTVAPYSMFLVRINDKILETLQYKGVFSGRFIFWNSFFALCILTAVCFMARWFPASALYSSFFLYQTLFMFIFVWPRWRYLYYLYLGGIFLPPIFLFELKRLLSGWTREPSSLDAKR